MVDAGNDKHLVTVERVTMENYAAIARVFDEVPPIESRDWFSSTFHRALAALSATHPESLMVAAWLDARAVGYALGLRNRMSFFLSFARRHPWLFARYLGLHALRTVLRRVTGRAEEGDMALVTGRADSTLHIQSMGTLPTVRGQGIGNRLRRGLVECARADGYTTVWAHVDSRKVRWAESFSADGWRLERRKDGTFYGFIHLDEP